MTVSQAQDDSTQYVDGELESIGFTNTDANRSLLGRWRELSCLALGLLLLALVILVTCLWVMSVRQQFAVQLQESWRNSNAEYASQVDLLGRQEHWWRRKQVAIQQWHLERQVSQTPHQYLLFAQHLARHTQGKVQRLVWDGQQLHLFLRSNQDWQAIQQGLQGKHWLRVKQIHHADASQAAKAGYHYQLALTLMEPE